ncbi:transporter [Roseateles sp. GG27B]
MEAVARLGLVTKFTLEATGAYRTRRFSAIEYARLEVNQNRFSLGVVYRPSTNLSLGVAGRVTKDNYPRYTLSAGNYSAGEFERNDIDLTGRWAISGASTLEGRLSSGRSKVISGVGTDFSGVTGLIGWTWQPTARWNVSTNLSRDTGLETSFFSLGTSIFNADQNRLTNALRFNASYDWSSKVALNAGFSLSKTDRTNDFLGQSASNYDRDTLFNLGVRYQLSRGIQLSCQYSKQARASSTPVYVYDANSYGCSGQIILN